MRGKSLHKINGGTSGAQFRGVLVGGAIVCSVLLGLATSACEDPFEIEWVEIPDTTLLYSMARPELNLVSAFDFLSGMGMPIESVGATGQWDVVLDTWDGALVLSPPGVFGIESEARIAVLEDIGFWDVERAPSDTTLYVRDASVPLVMGNVYVIRTREITDAYGSACFYHVKLEPLIIGLEDQTLNFQYLLNPNCNSFRLVSR